MLTEQTLERLDFTMSVENYINHWGAWEAWRELESNARDTGAPYTIIKDGNDLVFQDEGEGLQVEDLILGMSSSRNDDNKIGQFGEGMKLALLIYTRMGKKVEIHSPHLYAETAIKMIKNIPTFSLLYREQHNGLMIGTKIIVRDYDGEMFGERFIQPDDERFLVQVGSRTILESNDLFVKGVFCQKLEGFEFGYDLPKVEMNRDRNVAKWESLMQEIARLWETVEDVDGWKIMIGAMLDGKKEKEMNISAWNMTSQAEQALKTAWVQLFGDNAVVGGDGQEIDNEAKHRKARPVNCSMLGGSMKHVLKQQVKTSKTYVDEQRALHRKTITQNSLSSTQKQSLSVVKRLAKKLDYNGTIKIEDLNGIAHGMAFSKQKSISLDPDALNDSKHAISVFIHEMAHVVSGCDDMTEGHINAISDLGAKLASILLKL